MNTRGGGGHVLLFQGRDRSRWTEMSERSVTRTSTRVSRRVTPLRNVWTPTTTTRACVQRTSKDTRGAGSSGTASWSRGGGTASSQTCPLPLRDWRCSTPSEGNPTDELHLSRSTCVGGTLGVWAGLHWCVGGATDVWAGLHWCVGGTLGVWAGLHWCVGGTLGVWAGPLMCGPEQQLRLLKRRFLRTVFVS